jgi:hypothetical protein
LLLKKPLRQLSDTPATANMLSFDSRLTRLTLTLP